MSSFEQARARFQLAMQKFERGIRPKPRRKPPSAGPVTVERPRQPTLSRGAATSLDPE